MATAIRLVLILHIISGTLALGCGLLSMLNRKGGKAHRATGKLFFRAMTGVFVSATFISLAKDIPFLFMVGFFSYYLACSGYRVLWLKKLHLGQRATWLDWLISSVGILAGLGLVLYSIGWFQARGPWGLVPLSFGLVCTFFGFRDLQSFRLPPANKQHWLLNHGGRMAGAFAATLTAFTVVNVQIGAWTWTLWLLPGLVVYVWQKRLMRRYAVKIPRPGSQTAL